MQEGHPDCRSQQVLRPRGSSTARPSAESGMRIDFTWSIGFTVRDRPQTRAPRTVIKCKPSGASA
eukprot:2006924-Alexandrium_andersonii.AAC.1